MTQAQAINKVITIAKAEVGYLEKASNAQLDNFTANAGSANYTKYWRDIKPEYQGQPWCACFVTWCFVNAFGGNYTRQLLKHYPYVYCPTMASLFTLNANPKVGDIVIFKRNGEFVHTGIVTAVNGDYFETVEGNTSGGSTIIANGGGVCKKSYYNSKLPGTKFCTPDWSIVASGEEELTLEQYNEIMGVLKTMQTQMNTMQTQMDAMQKEIDLLNNVVESTFIYNYIDENMPEWAREPVQAAIDAGILQGDSEGLHLSYKDLRRITENYRMGYYNKSTEVAE